MREKFEALINAAQQAIMDLRKQGPFTGKSLSQIAVELEAALPGPTCDCYDSGCAKCARLTL